MKQRAALLGLAMATLLAAAFLIGMSCSGDGPIGPSESGGSRSSVTRLPDPDDVIDEELMIGLGQAKNFHAKAKVYMSDGKVTEAIAAVRQILSLRFPPNSPEADDVRNDARALLGRLLVGQNQLDEAMRVVEEGLATVTRESFFVANLYTVKGEIHYARASQITDPNDPRAGVEKRAAIEALDRSIQINDKLLKSLPANGTTPTTQGSKP
jgi:tetratricopeptide (TPR) repeat protein